jgi:hypothetical protein
MGAGLSRLEQLRRAAARPLAGVRSLVDRGIDAQILSKTGLRRISDTMPNDVFICGFPKSGNTWFQHLVTAVVYGLDVTAAPDSLINELVPDVHFKSYYRRFRDTAFFKSHHLPQPSYRRIVYLIRDGRDAMVSYYHHLTALGGPVDFKDVVTTGRGLFPSKWHEHVEAYRALARGPEMIEIRYESLKRDPVAELRRFCVFAGLDRTDAVLGRAVEQASFQNMRAKEKTEGWDTVNWPKDKPFVRRGEVGSFKDEMPPDVLAAFVAEAGPTLSAKGY